MEVIFPGHTPRVDSYLWMCQYLILKVKATSLNLSKGVDSWVRDTWRCSRAGGGELQHGGGRPDGQAAEHGGQAETAAHHVTVGVHSESDQGALVLFNLSE